MSLRSVSKKTWGMLTGKGRPADYRKGSSSSLLYCVGTAKSGTQSIAAMFDETVRAQHEPEHKEMIRMIIDHSAGKVTREQLNAWVVERDKRLNLDVDSSFLNYHIIDALVEQFGDARFLLTIRDCYSWLNSIANYTLRFFDAAPVWREFRDFRFRRDDLSHAAGDEAFKKKNLYPIESYLSHWASHNDDVLRKVPANRLLVVRTDQISARSREIATFASIPATAIRANKTHVHENASKSDLVRELDQDYLEMKVEQHCRPLMQQFFPEIRSLSDARL
jgi:hypothetical protein